jgi:cell division protein FtsL
MSDTSVMESRDASMYHSNDEDMHDVDTNIQQKHNEWTTGGSKVCVIILAVLVVLLSLALIYVSFKYYTLSSKLSPKTVKHGTKSNSNTISSSLNKLGVQAIDSFMDTSGEIGAINSDEENR